MTTVDPRPHTDPFAAPPATTTAKPSPDTPLSAQRGGTGAVGSGPGGETAEKPARPGSRRPAWDPFTIAGVAFAMIVALVGGFIIYLATVSDLQQARTQRNLYERVSDDFYSDVAPLGGTIKEGTPVALLEIPAIDVRQVVVEGTTASLLRGGPGHLRNTGLPGQFGNSVIMGKAWTYGAPFGDIGDLKPGQKINVTTQQGPFTYIVRSTTHIGDGDDDAISPGGAHQLTLVTADSWIRPDGRTAVVADLQGAFQVGASGRPKVVRDDEKGTGGESGAGVALLLWAQALVAVAAVGVWALRRYDRRVTLLLGTPVTLAVVWSLYDTAARLLPATV